MCAIAESGTSALETSDQYRARNQARACTSRAERNNLASCSTGEKALSSIYSSTTRSRARLFELCAGNGRCQLFLPRFLTKMPQSWTGCECRGGVAKDGPVGHRSRRKPYHNPLYSSIMAAKFIPEGYHSTTPYLIMRGASRALDFYGKVFGAKEILRMPTPDGLIAHAEMQIGDSRIMLADEMPNLPYKGPQSLGGTSVCLMVYVADVDKTFAAA